MRLHITNLYGQSIDSVGQKAQNAVAKIVRRALDANELEIFYYNVKSDSHQMLSARIDGIIAGVKHEDIVIFQYPTWNDMLFEEEFITRLNFCFKGVKIVFLIHDLPPLMDEWRRDSLNRCIALFNQADLLILPSKSMEDFLHSKGLTVEKNIILGMFDYCVDIDQTITPRFKKIINFAGNPNVPKFNFVKNWNFATVQLAITGEPVQGRNVISLGWFRNDNLLVNALRNSGGFGIVWSNDPYWKEYMKLNANYKLSTYLAAGIPVIVGSDIAEKDTIIRKNLGLVVESLDEAVDRVTNMKEEQYNKMVEDVGEFSNLLRGGCFVKKAMIETIFRLLYD